MQAADIVIVGGGMVGLTAALALRNSDLQVVVLDPHTATEVTDTVPRNRVSAINLAAQRLLTNLGVWQGLPADRLSAYQSMDVWEQDSFAGIQFSHQDAGQPMLGHIIENDVLRYALWQAVSQHANMTVVQAGLDNIHHGQRETVVHLDNGEMVSASLVVGADGAHSKVRELSELPQTFWDYEQTALVATVKTEEAHEQCARQVFTPHGPLAFLPLKNSELCSIVWSVQHDRAQALLALSPTQFEQALTVAFDRRLGLCEVQGDIGAYPLRMRYSRQWVDDRVVLIGDAAHTIHPLAGQGVNLGLMDAAALAEKVLQIHASGADIGQVSQLRSFERWRKSEALKMSAAMEGFKRLYDGQNPLQKLVRGLGMSAVNRFPPARELAVKQAMGLVGELPSLAR